MDISAFIIFWWLFIIVVVVLLIKKPSIPKKASKPANQGPEKAAPVDSFCEACNQLIPNERLASVPDAVLCISCQAITEKKQSAAFPELQIEDISDYEQNHYDPYDDFEDEEDINSAVEDKIDYFSLGLEAYKKGDYIDARKYFHLSGDYFYLGLIYENGLGVNRDYQEAAKYYWEASNTGSMANAQIRLGRMYQDGRGVKKSYPGALKWYDKAEENCREYEKSKILNQIAANIRDMGNEDQLNPRIDRTIPMNTEDLSLHPRIKIEFYDKNNYELDVLSVAAGKTKDLIEKYHIHSCPDYYAYKRTKYITFRAGDTGEMDGLYEIKKILLVPVDARDNLDILERHGLTSNEVLRLTRYMQKNPFPDNYRYYILSRVKDLPDRPKPSELNAKTIYYSLSQLGENSDTKNKLIGGDLLEQTESHNLSKHDVKASEVGLVSDECLSELYKILYKDLSHSYQPDSYLFDSELNYYIKNTFELIADHISKKRIMDKDSDIYRILKKHGVVK
jgi:hypothetical protein